MPGLRREVALPTMKARIYRPVMEDETIEVTPEDVARGYTHIECGACQGTGVFQITDDHEIDCVECSTRGTRAVSI